MNAANQAYEAGKQDAIAGRHHSNDWLMSIHWAEYRRGYANHAGPLSVSNERDGNGWWKHITPAGNVMWTGRRGVPMAELEEVDAIPDQVPDCDEDPDADGYGWERAALRGIS